MDVYGLVVGILVFAAGVFIAATNRDLAERMHRYWNRPRRQGRFAWLDRRIATPSMSAARLMAWAFGAAVGALGLAFIVVSVPK